MRNNEIALRHAQSTRGGFVLVSLYSWMVITVGVVVARFVRGLVVHKIKFGADDAAALASIVVYFGTVASWQNAVDAGLGKKSKDLDPQDISLFSKAMVATGLLEIATMSLAKLSSAFLIERVAPQSRNAKTGLFTLVGIWGVFSSFAIAFRCGLPLEWASPIRRCGNSGLLVAVIVLNMTTDLILATWMFPTLVFLSLDKEKRFTAMMLFGSRAIVSVIAGGQIWAAIKATSSDDTTRDTSEFAVLSQAVTSLSLITANVPRIKRLLGVGGSGILYPEIQASELSTTHRAASPQTSTHSTLVLVPSGSGKSTVTVTSKDSKKKGISLLPLGWQGFATRDNKKDEYDSTSSSFDRSDREGVILEREFRVVVEDSSAQQHE